MSIWSRTRKARAGRRVTIALVSGALLAAGACSSGDNSSGGAAATSGAATTASGSATTAASGATTAAGGGTTTVQPKTGGTFKFLGATEPSSFDSARLLGNPFSDGDVPFALYDNFVEFDAKGEMVPRLAAAVTPDSTFTVWTIKMRPGVKFSDGTPYNAAAVKFTWDRMMAPETASPCRPTISLGTYTVVDDLTLQVTLKQANSAWPINLVACAGMIGSPTAIQKDPQAFGTHPVGAGPFVLQSWTPGSQAVFTRNPNYWDAPRPYLDSLVLRWLGNTTQRYQSFTANEADGVFFVNPVTEVKRLLDEKVDYVKPALVGGVSQVLNSTVPGLNDIRVRQALALATDPADIVAKTAGGTVEASNAFFPAESPWASPAQPQQHVNDLAKAQTLMDQYVAEKGPLTINMITSAPPRAANEALQQQWSRLKGVTVNLQFIENPIPQMSSGDFGAVSISASGRDPEFLKRFTTGFASNFGKYSNPQVDALIQQGRETSDFAARQKAYNQALDIMFNDVAFILLVPVAQYTFLHDKVHLTQFGDGMWDFATVWLD